MQTSEGMIETAKRRGQPSKKDPKKTVYFVDVVVDGQEFSGFADYDPNCVGMLGQENHFVRIEWEAYGAKKDIKKWEFIAAKSLAPIGADNARMTDKDILIAGQNCNNATAVVFSQVVRFGYFVNEADVIPAWERYLKANRKMMGLE